MNQIFTSGSHVVVRDAEWRIKRIDNGSDGGCVLTCFLTALEPNIYVLAPKDIRIVPDISSNYIASCLYLDTLTRQGIPEDNKTYVAYQAALDVIPYQLEPAYRTLSQPRQCILRADVVGLGKTLRQSASSLISRLSLCLIANKTMSLPGSFLKDRIMNKFKQAIKAATS